MIVFYHAEDKSMQEVGGAQKRDTWPVGLVAICGALALVWASSGMALAESPGPARGDQIEALAFDPFRLVTDKELLAVLKRSFAAESQPEQPRGSVASSAASASATSPTRAGTPVPSSTTAGFTSLTSAATLVKAFFGQALLIPPRPPLRTPVLPTWP